MSIGQGFTIIANDILAIQTTANAALAGIINSGTIVGAQISLVQASGSTITLSGTLPAGGSGGTPNPITGATTATTIAATDYVGVSEASADKKITVANFVNGSGTTVATYLAANPGSPAGTDTLLAVQGSAVVGETLAAIASYVLAQLPTATLPSVIVSTTTPLPLDHATHHRRTLVCTAAATLNAPSSFSNVGDGFECTIINVSGGVVTFGSGITITSGGTTLAAGYTAKVYGFTAASNNYIFVAVAGGGGAAVPTISINTIATQAPSTAFTVSGSLIAYASAPTLTYSDDGTTYGALPGGATVTSTTFSFTHPGIAANASARVYVKDAAGSVIGTSNAFAVTVNPTLTLTTPSTTVSGAAMALAGSYTGTAPTGIAASFDSGTTWTTASGFTASGGTYSASVTAPAAGTYTVRARETNATSVTATASGTTTVTAAAGLANTLKAQAFGGGTLYAPPITLPANYGGYSYGQPFMYFEVTHNDGSAYPVGTSLTYGFTTSPTVPPSAAAMVFPSSSEGYPCNGYVTATSQANAGRNIFYTHNEIQIVQGSAPSPGVDWYFWYSLDGTNWSIQRDGSNAPISMKIIG